MKGFILLLALFFALPFANALIFSEIMYNPPQNENYNEWIEVYNDGNAINLSEWKLCNSKLLAGYVDHNDSKIYENSTLVLNQNSYAILTDGGTGTDAYRNFNFKEDAIALHVDASSLCNVLTNSGKEIFLNSSAGKISVLYNSSWGANGNNNSLQYNGSGWCEGIPTPGAANSCSAPPEEEEENNSESISQNNTMPPSNSSSNDSFSNSSQSACNGLNITLSDHPSEMRFGDSGKVRIDANLTCYEKSSITFLVYGSSSRVISSENGSKITSYASCQNGKEFSVEKKEYSWDIDFFSCPNCDNGYKEGNYSVSVRGCDSSGSKIYEEDFAINLSGANSSRCGSELSVEEESSAAETGPNDTAEEKSLEPLMKITSKTSSKNSSSSNSGAEVVYGTKNSFERKVALYLVGMLSALLLIYLLREGKI
jgi:hypothetical protein